MLLISTVVSPTPTMTMDAIDALVREKKNARKIATTRKEILRLNPLPTLLNLFNKTQTIVIAAEILQIRTT